MFNYTNVKCDVCNEAFTKDSDIVVCPICGTPHHRHCYKELSHCVNINKHKDGFEWENPNDKKIEPQVELKTEKMCKTCQRINAGDAENCNFCGASFIEDNQNQNPETMMNDNKTIPNVSTPFPKSPLDFIQQLNNDLSSEIDGVLVKDIAIYLGPNAYDYIRKFKKMQDNPRYRPFCLAAVFFGWPYFLYRKMWNIGLASLIISLAASNYLNKGLVNPQLFYDDPLMSFVAIGILVFSVALGFIAYPAMKKKTINDLIEIKATTSSDEDYYKEISKKSGPSKIVLTLGLFYWIYLLFFM